MARTDYDVIIAGAGVAGVAAAAALEEFGWSVLVVEPGQHDDRRLGGELIHPAGVRVLKELGIFDGEFKDGISMKGFVAIPGNDEDWSNIPLPYSSDSDQPSAVALDHAKIRAALMKAARSMPHVTLQQGGRVVGLENGASEAVVTVQEGERLSELTCRLVVAADGASSRVRMLAGVTHWRRPVSAITGYLISDANLPARGFGHVFLGASAPLLVYEIGGGKARVLFDQPVVHSDVPQDLYRGRAIAAIPYPELRAEIQSATEQQRGLRFNSIDVVVERSSHGNVVLVGDAGGSCHPLTATGMTISLKDALRLRNALQFARGNIPAALTHYSRLRRPQQRTRFLVASALHEACTAIKPELRLIRTGLIQYWTQDMRGRRSTMALLAMSDHRLLSALHEIFVVIGHGVAAQWTNWSIAGIGPGLRLMTALAGTVIRQVGFAMRAR